MKPIAKFEFILGNITFADISVNVSINSYLAFLFGGYMRKIECKLRPYEKQKGETEAVVKKSMQLLYETFENGTSKEHALKQVIAWVKEIEVKDEKRPKVAIFGDLYARDNDVFNQDLIGFIERNGGEAITTPYSDYIKIIYHASNTRVTNEGYYLRAADQKIFILTGYKNRKQIPEIFQ